MSPLDWEEFIEEWMSFRSAEYYDFERLGGAGDQGNEVTWAARDLLSIHPDGCAARQQQAQPLQRQRCRGRPARIPLAGKDHVLPSRWICWVGR